jgi:hypothetical protein
LRLKSTPLALILTALAASASAETTRSLRAELDPAESARFAIENLAGSMKITSGAGSAVVVLATVHAESDALADALQFERRTGKAGERMLRLKYPVDRYTAYRYPGAGGTSNLRYSETGETEDHGFWGGGTRISVSSHAGVLLYADLEIQLPSRSVQAGFFNRVGPISAAGVRGTLRFDSAGGDVTLSRVSGDVLIDTGSGDASATDCEGSLRCDTGSGNCDIARFSGEHLAVDTGSGELRLTSVKATHIDADTGSGDVVAEDVEMETFKADTGSGDVRLRLPRDSSFEMLADTGSGDIVSHFSDAEAIVRRREVVGYRRGDGRVKIDLDTGSGDVVIEPSK